MTNVIPMFDFNGVRLRGTIIDDQPRFVAGDVCRILGVYVYNGQPNPSLACRKLGADETALYPITGSPHIGRHVSESGLYKLIMRCDKPVASQFQDWVTREVLPSIRRTGGYVAKDADVDAVLDQQPTNRVLTYSRYCIPAARDANGTATAFRCPVRHPRNPSS